MSTKLIYKCDVCEKEEVSNEHDRQLCSDSNAYIDRLMIHRYVGSGCGNVNQHQQYELMLCKEHAEEAYELLTAKFNLKALSQKAFTCYDGN